ncbi:MAG TPA: Sec-independent protein translocase protein TatB [Xanthobacteraceae bacterium]|jgi:sec-independent protein translocase protein TatB|nr:sec-independent protein translocase protein TatB [Alphaproteobacteria bacterium]
MFDIGWGELLVIGMVALVAIGPKELPGVLRTVGQWTGKLRRMATEFQNQFHEAMREAELADLKKQVDEMTSEVRSYGSFDPVSDVRRELEKTQSQIENAMAEKPTAEKAAPQSVAENLASSMTSSTDPVPADAPSAASNVAAPDATVQAPSEETSAGTHDAQGKAI